MPTIDELPAATASASTDEIMCSQGGVSRKATVAQIIAAAQPLIALPQGTLLGRFDSGTGGVEPISVGPNLTLASGALSANAPFAAAGLPPAANPAPGDIVPLGQAGQNVGASYAQFMAGIATVAGINASAMVARATGSSATRTLANLFDDAVSPEDFGAAGDGLTDDTAALAAALGSGQPVRLGPKTYATSGQWTITGAAATLLGVPGQTVIRRLRQASGGAWISVQATTFRASGIVFDANTAVINDTWGVLVAPVCTDSDFHLCNFINARGPTLGCGLTFQAADPATTLHAVRACEATNNAVHGIWAQALEQVRIDGCRAYGNAQYGICLDYADPALVQKLRYGQVVNCTAWGNARGISLGNYNATNTTPPVWGNANPDAICHLVAGNICHDNASYGIAVAGQAVHVANNQLASNGVPGGAGLLANVSYSRIAGNVITGASQYGIDAGGSILTDISGNHVSGAVHGINCGGGQNVRVGANVIQDCTGWSVLVNNVETDGAGNNFGLACSDLAITDNWIGFSIGGGGGGILLLDNPQNVRVARNCLVGSGAATVGLALWPNSNSVTITDNIWNFSPRASIASSVGASGLNQLVYPDLLSDLLVTGAVSPIGALISTRQQALAGQLGFIAVTNGGRGYTSATVTITGDGSGAAAIAYVSNGAVIGISLTNPGSGYSTATVAISGTGTAAAATAQIGLPLLEQRQLTVRAAVAVVFSRAATSSPAQQNWTGYDFTVPTNAEVAFNGRGGSWYAGVLPLADYIAPNGAGGVALATQNNADLVLQPGGTGHVRIASASEATGVTSSIGRGSPVNTVSAPPGSDYRNLNGGVGSTYWVKQTGTGNTGWIAVA